MKQFNGFLFFLNITLGILTIGAYMAPYFHPKDSVFFSLIGLVFPLLVMGNIAFILYWLLFKPKNSLGSLLILLLGISNVMDIFNIQQATSQDNPSNSIKIASYNMQFSMPVRSKTGWHKAVTETDFKAHLQQFTHLDIICFQEHGTYSEKQLTQLLKLPYHHFSIGKYVAIYSRFPIIDAGQITNFSSNDANACIWADISIRGKTIRVYSAHFEANRQDGVVPNTIVESTYEPPVDASMAVGLVRYYQKFSARRADQAMRLRAIMAESPYPTILCGDMNDTPQTHVYKILEEGQQDTFREKGLGLGATFGSTLKNKLALLRIDYIFANPSFTILSHQIFPAPFSDHYLIYSKIQLP